MGRARKTSNAGVLNYGSYEIYRDYKHCREALEFDLVEKDVHREVLKRCYELIYQSMIKNLMIFKAPYDLGDFYIKELISDSARYKDWKATREKGEMVYSVNTLTGKLKWKYYWNKMLSRNQLVRCYWFRRIEGDEEDRTGAMGLKAEIFDTYRDPYKENFRAYLE